MTNLSPAESSNDASRAQRRRLVIGSLIALACALFLLTAVVLYYRWITMIEPNCVIVVEASPALKGATLSVDNIMLTRPLKATIGEKDRYAIPFYVDPGEYEVKAILDGEVVFETSVILSDQARGLRLNLTKLKPTTTPALDDTMK